ncbi:MAG TPA: sulfite exporter TauE/SafE family protein [Candidatus Nanopelagicaceae bacterium]
MVLTGFLVGAINGMAGGASIISYPVMLALGLHPLDATVTNALGTSSANFFAIPRGQRAVKNLIRSYRTLIVISVVGSLIGTALLLSFPPQVFERIVPFLVLGATLTMLLPAKPKVGRRNEVIEIAGIAASGLYCGYFGPGQGVMVVASLARNPKGNAEAMNAAKNIIVGVTSLAADFIYLFSGRAHWIPVLALFIGSSFGGTLGGKWATRMSPVFYKVLVMTVGFGASIWLFFRYFF